MKHLMHHHHTPATASTTATAATATASTTGRNPALFQHHPHHGRNHPPHQRGVYTLAHDSIHASSSAAEQVAKKRPRSQRAAAASAPPSAAGVKRLWRGVQTMFVGCIPAHALYFSSYELVKKLCADGAPASARERDRDRDTLTPAGAMLAGGIAALLHDSVMTPMDTVKQRMQLGHYDGMRHAFASIVRGDGRRAAAAAGEGWRGLYRSFPVTVATNVPYGMIVVTVNERLRGALEEGLYGGREGEAQRDDGDGAERPFHFATVLLSGMGAGTVAAAATAPLDRVKTRLQTQRMGLVVAGMPPDGAKAIAEERALAASRGEVRACPKMVAREVREALFSSSSSSSGSGSGSTSSTVTGNVANTHVHKNKPFHNTYYTTPREAFRSIVQEEGYRGLFRGTLPRVALHAPSVAISWTAYEMAKGWLLWWVD
mmetsp:Transcript_3372/g.7477  ORF Transcript_3372/g.7477 Transcript_3372/m.7477 type:complete len:430 (-) Transcript_3372:645-1934(-)